MPFAGRAYFTGEGNIHEVVVDNEDSAFRVQEKKSFHLQDFFNKGEKVYKGIFMFPDERVWKKAVEVEDNFGGKLFGTPVSRPCISWSGMGVCRLRGKPISVKRESTRFLFTCIIWG